MCSNCHRKVHEELTIENENKDIMCESISNSIETKNCFSCGKILPVSMFYLENNKINHVNVCKKCVCKEKRSYKNIIKFKAIQLLNDKCLDCNKKYDPYVYDFHHYLENKEHSISKMIRKKYNWQNIKDELDKCILLCSNCHRLRHTKK